MRLVSYGEPGGERAGLLLGDHVLDIERATGGATGQARGGAPAATAFPGSVRELFRSGRVAELAALVPGFEARLGAAGREGFPPGACFARRDVRLGPPVPDASKIICVGLNYRDHAREQGKEPPSSPLLFAKAPSALAGPQDPIAVTAGVTQVDFELELGVVIARVARRVPESAAMDYVGGYMLFLDMTDREAQYGDKQWFRGKSHDGFAPSGPWLVPAGEHDPDSLAMRLEVNGHVEQDSSTAEMIHKVPALIAYITRSITFVPGDIIATGTPAGVGVFQKPPRFLLPGDRIRAEIESLGVLETTIELER